MGHTSSISSRHPLSTEKSFNSIIPLYEACRDGNEKQVRALLPKYTHADLNRQLSLYGGNTCLHIATKNSHENIVKLLLQHGCYRSSLLNSDKQSAYDIAQVNKASIRVLFLRHNEYNPSTTDTSRFYEKDVTECFDIVKNDDNELQPSIDNRKNSILSFKTEEDKKHEIEYSASSKAMCQSRLGRFCVNHLHSDEPLDSQTITKRLNNLFQTLNIKNSDDYIKASDLIKDYEKKSNMIEQLLHLYTLETEFYRRLREDCLPLAIPLFIHLPDLKERFFKGRVYRGMYMTYEQFLIYQFAMETPGTLLQTRAFSSTSLNRLVAEQFAYEKTGKTDSGICVVFIFDFPEICDQAINLSRISTDGPCLSEYANEEEVLILPWTLFAVTRVRQATDEDDLYTINLTNVIIPNKSLLSTFKWSWEEFKNQFSRDKKLKFDCAFQKYKTTVTTSK